MGNLYCLFYMQERKMIIVIGMKEDRSEVNWFTLDNNLGKIRGAFQRKHVV